MWTYIELTSTADRQERLGVITSLATPCVITRMVTSHRNVMPAVSSHGHRSRGRWFSRKVQ